MVDYKASDIKKSDNWWQSSLGRSIVQQEQALLLSRINYFHGYIQVQLGLQQKLLPETVRPCYQYILAQKGDLIANNEALPFKQHSIDTLVLCHTLEFSADPHQILREAERVLVADGTLILTSFNPWSLWGLRRLLSWQDTTPWYGHFFSQSRIKDWLALLNFDVVVVDRLLFRIPIQSEKWYQRFQFIERWGQRLWPIFSGATIVIATKRTVPLTPVKAKWRTQQLFPTGQLINKPVIREKSDG